MVLQGMQGPAGGGEGVDQSFSEYPTYPGRVIGCPHCSGGNQSVILSSAASASKPDSTNADERDEKAIAACLDSLSGAEECSPPGEAASASQPDSTNAANAGQGAPALSSAAGTGQIALAKVGGRASQPATSHVLSRRAGSQPERQTPPGHPARYHPSAAPIWSTAADRRNAEAVQQ